jgi:predicted Zn finger-like uncharacterized protein
MIVNCSSCQTRFRVSMDKCGPKGARIRCSCCNAVFVVRPPAEPPAHPTPSAPAPALAALDLVTPPREQLPRPSLPLDPFAPVPLGAAQSLAASLDGERDPFAPAPSPQVVSDLDALLGGVPAPSTAQIGWGEIDLGTPPAPAPLAPARGAAPVPPPLPPAAASAPTPPPLPAATPPPVVPHATAAAAAPTATAAAPAAAPRAVGDVRTPRPATPLRRARRGRAARALESTLSLVLLLAIAAAIFVARGAGRGAGFSALLRGGAAIAAEPPFTVQARAGVYDTAAGPQVVVVRGTVAARAGSEGPVRVSVELVDGDQAVARGDALAGAVPTPEEVYAAGTAEGAAALRRAASAGASPRLAPGVRAPFAVVLADVPPDLRRVEVRTSAALATPEPRPR